MLTYEEAHELLYYKDGVLFWRENRGVNKVKGRVAGSKRRDGYWGLRIKKKSYLAHRIIFLMFHGYCPTSLDHINGDRGDSRIENLRPANSYQNNRNSKRRVDNKSGTKGVWFVPHINKWQAMIYVDNRRINLGYFEAIEEARTRATKARELYHGDFANHGDYNEHKY